MNSTEKTSNVLQVKEFLSGLKTFLVQINKDYNDKLTSLENNSNGILKVNTDIDVLPLESGIKFSRIVKRTDGEAIYVQKIVNHSTLEIKKFEAEYPIGFTVGVAKIIFNDGTSYYGLVHVDSVQPFLLGVWTDNSGKEEVKLDYGVEFGVAAWSETDEPLEELIKFLSEQVVKGYLETTTFFHFIDLFYSRQNEDDLLESISLRNTAFLKNTTLLKVANEGTFLDDFYITFKQFSEMPEKLRFNITTINGEPTIYRDIDLDTLIELATTLATHYKETKQMLFEKDMLAKKIPLQWMDGWEDLKKHLNLPEGSKFYVSTLDNLAEAELYIKTPSESIKSLGSTKVTCRFSSTTGRANYTAQSLDLYYELYNQAQRWVDYYVTVNIEVTIPDGSVKKYEIFWISSNNVYDAARKLLK